MADVAEALEPDDEEEDAPPVGVNPHKLETVVTSRLFNTWYYRTMDAPSVVMQPDYFAAGVENGLREGDIIECLCSDRSEGGFKWVSLGVAEVWRSPDRGQHVRVSRRLTPSRE